MLGAGESPEGSWNRILAQLLDEHGDRYPLLAAAVEDTAGGAQENRSLEFGLERILDGLEHVLGDRPPAAAAATAGGGEVAQASALTDFCQCAHGESMSTKGPDAWSTFAMELFTVNGLVMRAGETIARPVGQSSARWQVLGRAFQPSTVPSIARDVGLARQTVQRTANLLADEGLLHFRAHASDRRTQLVELTQEGRRVVSALHDRQVRWSERLLEELDARTLLHATGALTKIASVLRRYSETGQTDPGQEEEQS
jgi:DNA-binding MarR family transcriptional regulator